MKKRLLLVWAFFVAGTSVFAQIQGDGGLPRSQKLVSTAHIPRITFAQPDVAALLAEDAIVDETKSAPWRFGLPHATDITLSNSGSWTDLPNGGKVWRVELKCENAVTVNLALDQVKLPAGNELYVYNKDKSFVLGKFLDKHLYEGNLGTELVPGNTAIVEYYLASGNELSEASLHINTVTHGYRTANEFAEKAFGSSGSCNMNVNCSPDADPWQDEKRGVVMLVSGTSGFCTGSLVNNTQNDGTPYVLTANHCYSNPSSWIFRFNWEAAGCSNPGSSPSYTSMSGAVLRARRTPSDFCLVEITGDLQGGTVPASYNPYFNGWDHSGTNPTSTVCIHHPSGDIKKISFDDAGSVPVTAMGSSESLSSWQVEWDRNTTTEPGSSGSPLFDQNHRIIGQLWGGGASCSNLSANDFYGRFYNSWEPSGSNSTNQLKFWLDPSNSGVDFVDGYDPNAVTVMDDAGITQVNSPVGLSCDPNVTPQVTLRNFGINNLTSVTINYDIDGGTNNTFAWTGTLTPGQTALVTLPALTTTNGAHVLNASTSVPNGVSDANTANDDANSNFNISSGQPVSVIINTDCWGYETYWEIEDGSSNVVASGGNDQLVLPGGDQSLDGSEPNAYGDETTVVTNLCLATACYTFVIYDDYGDGMQGTSSGCPSDGSYSIEDGIGTVLASIQSVNFGDNESNPFCVSSPCASTFTYSTVEEDCFGDGDGSVTVTFTTGNQTGATYDIGSGAQGSGTFTGLSAGSYSVTVVDGDGCTSVVPVTLGGPAMLAASVTNVTNDAGGNSGAINITVTGGSTPYVYAWTGPNGYTAATEDISGLAAGTYSVIITDDCSNTTTLNNINVSDISGISELEAGVFVVYPNPNNGHFAIKLNNEPGEAYAIRVLDLSGRVIHEQTATSSYAEIMVDKVSAGTYVLQLQSSTFNANRAILIQR